MKRYIVLAVLCVVGTWYVVQSCADKRSYTHYRALQDSLGRVVVESRVREETLVKNARLAYKAGLDAQAVKVVIRTVYRKDTASNHRLTLHAKDSVLKTDLPGDSTKFTDRMANKVLDIQSENKALKAEARQDSTTISKIKIAFHGIDSANMECHIQNATLTQSLSNAESRVKKERAKSVPWKIATGVLALALLCL